MNENVYKVLMGFIKLTDAEKALFITELNKYQQAGYYDKINLRESFNSKSSVGPKNSICTCCGR
jgi:hypothetical protein